MGVGCQPTHLRCIYFSMGRFIRQKYRTFKISKLGVTQLFLSTYSLGRVKFGYDKFSVDEYIGNVESLIHTHVVFCILS